MANHCTPLEAARFLWIVAVATEIRIENLRASTDIEDACLLALDLHRKAVEQNVVFVQVLALLGAEIMQRRPAPDRNDVVARMAMDELLAINGCRWLYPDAYSTPLGARLTDSAGEKQRLDLASWLESQVACQ